MGAAFRRFVVLCMIVIAAGYYIRAHYHFTDLLDYVEEHPDSFANAPVTDYSIGLFYYMRDRCDPAVHAFDQLLTDYPTSQFTEDALFHLGVCYEELRNWPKARDAYKQYMDQFPDGKAHSDVKSNYEHIKFN